jgi:TPR repeat protein
MKLKIALVFIVLTGLLLRPDRAFCGLYGQGGPIGSDPLIAKAVAFNQAQADKGDAYGLLRMGERYRDGDGVPKDLVKAKDYFTKAVAAGSTDAANELAQLNSN